MKYFLVFAIFLTACIPSGKYQVISLKRETVLTQYGDTWINEEVCQVEVKDSSGHYHVWQSDKTDCSKYSPDDIIEK